MNNAVASLHVNLADGHRGKNFIFFGPFSEKCEDIEFQGFQIRVRVRITELEEKLERNRSFAEIYNFFV